MTDAQRLQLLHECANLKLAASHLGFSIERTQPLIGKLEWSPEELEPLESLCSRFARLSDLLTQRLMRLVDYIELTPEGSLLDRIHRAEKRGWTQEANLLIRIRELRNVIAHEYAASKMSELYTTTSTFAPKLLSVVPLVVAYCENLAASGASVGADARLTQPA